MTSVEPIFIVGPSRSGTAMTRAVLNRHPDVAIAPETHWFDDLRVALGPAATGPLDEDQRRRCEDYFLVLSHRPYGHQGTVDGGWLDRDVLRAEADRLGGTGDAHFEAFCRLFAAREGATRWGEKTPRHIFRIDDILDRYPDARVVGLVRDPRSVVLSYRDWKHGNSFFDSEDNPDPDHGRAVAEDEARARRSYHPALLALLWRSQARALLSAVRRRPDRVRMVRYEELVADPETSVRDLAGWLDLVYTPAMLDIPLLNSSFADFSADGGISTEAVRRWSTRLAPHEVAVVQAACGSLLEDLGYERVDTGHSLREAATWATTPVAAARSIGANRERMARVVPYVARRARHLVGVSR